MKRDQEPRNTEKERDCPERLSAVVLVSDADGHVLAAFVAAVEKPEGAEEGDDQACAEYDEAEKQPNPVPQRDAFRGGERFASMEPTAMIVKPRRISPTAHPLLLSLDACQRLARGYIQAAVCAVRPFAPVTEYAGLL